MAQTNLPILFVFIVAVIILLVNYPWGVYFSVTEYYVSNSGSDFNDGLTPSTPWRTINKVNSEFGNSIGIGDNIYFCCGDSFTDAQLTIGISGESISNPTVIGAYGIGDKPVLSPGGYTVTLDSKENITFQDIKIEECSRWIHAPNGGNSYITFDNCDFYNSTAWGGIYFTNGNDHIIIRNCHFENNSEDVVELNFGTTYTLVENNTFRGGVLNDHDLIVIRGSVAYPSHYNIVRNNTFYQGSDQYIALSQEVHHCLIENNIVNGTDRNDILAGIKLCGTWNNIIRNNIIYDCNASAIQIYTNNPGSYESHGENNTVYHNTVYNCTGGDGYACSKVIVFDDPGGVLCNNVFKNNIFYKGYSIVYMDAVNPYDYLLFDNLWDNNIINGHTGTNAIKSNGTYYSLSQIESQLSDTFQNNTNLDPLLADAANHNFSLNDTSPCIDNASWLTTCDGGGTGTTVTVHDARYFCDGYGIVNGDDITIGTDDVTVTSVDYDNNNLTVNTSITWVDGDNVSLRYNGSAPDIGAIESARKL